MKAIILQWSLTYQLSSKINYDVLRGLKHENNELPADNVKKERLDVKKELKNQTDKEVEGGEGVGAGAGAAEIVYENGPTKRANKR